MNPFLNPHLYNFCKAWQAYNRQQFRSARFENSLPDGQTTMAQRLADLRLAWEGFVAATLEPQSALAFRLLLSYWERVKSLWLKRGGPFYTRYGTLRRGDANYLMDKREKLAPKVPENWKADLEEAERNWKLALEVESAKVQPSWLRRLLKGDSDFQNQLTVAMAVASGAVTGRPDEPTLLNGLKRKTLLWPTNRKTPARRWWQRRWGWQRIKGMKAAGWLESWGDGKRLK